MPERSDHIPVLLNEVISALKPEAGGFYLDGTFGAGGYSQALLKAADCKVWGIDCDMTVSSYAKDLLAIYPKKFQFLNGHFSNMIKLLNSCNVLKVNGIALDLGVSSMQIDRPERGFSLRFDGPLDMRMSNVGISAAEILNTNSEEEISNIIFKYGEERASRKVASAIVKYRRKKSITRTLQLANLVQKVVKKSKDGLHPATRTFQALRIYINRELDELEKGLYAAEQLLLPGGRLAIVSFHSLEDRRIKTHFRARSDLRERPSRHHPIPGNDFYPSSFEIISKRPIRPSKEELLKNSRAGSAKLRVAERTEAPPMQIV